MTISDFVRITRANLALLLACLILGGVAGYFYQLGLPRLYAADAAGYVVGGRATTTFDAQQSQTLAAQKASSYTGLVSTRGVGERIVKDLKLNASPMDVASKLSATVDQGSVLFRITAISTDPKEAQTLANAAIRATSAQANLIESGGNPSASDPVVKIIPLESAMLPGAPFTPNRDRYIQTGLAAGLLGGYVLVFLRRVLDRRVRHSGELEQMLNTSVLGIIPKVSELAGRRRGGGKPLGNAAESMRQLRTNLRFIDVDSKPRSIVVTSPNPGEGKSTVAANLARVLAASGQPTVLIDADLRRPMVGTVFDIDGSVGLTQTLAGDVPVTDVMQATSLSNLFIIPAGRIPPNPTELLGSQRMRDLVDTLGEKYLVILDAPPMLPVTDAGLLTAECDGCLLVIHVGKTYKEQAQMCAKALNQVGGRLFGTVMNMAPKKHMGAVVYGYGYGNYDSTYYSSKEYTSQDPESRAARKNAVKADQKEARLRRRARKDKE